MASDESITLKTQSGEVFGSLRMPSHPEQPLVVLIVAGSGPTDRDGNNTCFDGKNDSLKMLAEALADIGVASVRYDKRGVGASANAAACENELCFEDYVQDVVSWTSALAEDARFSAVLILGHSEGSLIGMLAAANSPAKAYISIAGPSRPAQLILREQLLDKLPTELTERSERILAALERGQTVEDVPTPLLALYRPSVQPYLISWFKYNPSAELTKLKIPCLILQGNTDTQVPGSDATSLHTAKPDSEMHIIDGMNHVLKQVPLNAARQLASFQDNSLPLVPELGGLLASFVAPFVSNTKACRCP
jgi:pimeloyl-ACP methyl ester carboxylesterase